VILDGSASCLAAIAHPLGCRVHAGGEDTFRRERVLCSDLAQINRLNEATTTMRCMVGQIIRDLGNALYISRSYDVYA